MATNDETPKKATASKAAASTVTPVRNNKPGIVTVSTAAELAPAKEGVSGGPALDPSKPAATRHLHHGWNLVPTEEWVRFKEQGTVKVLLTSKIERSRAPEFNNLAVGKTMLAEVSPVDAKDPLGKMSEEEAGEFIDDVCNAELLRMLLELEDRERVRAAIETRRNTPTMTLMTAGEARTTTGKIRAA